MNNGVPSLYFLLLCYRNSPRYSDNLALIEICLKFNKSIVEVLRHLIWVYTVCSGLPIRTLSLWWLSDACKRRKGALFQCRHSEYRANKFGISLYCLLYYLVRAKWKAVFEHERSAKTQISLHIHAVWSVFAMRNMYAPWGLDPRFPHTAWEGCIINEWVRRLIWVFSVRTYSKILFALHGQSYVILLLKMVLYECTAFYIISLIKMSLKGQ